MTVFFSRKMRRKTLSLQLGLSSAGSYVPGQDFDPKSRPFSQEELRPQPMSKKSKKQVQIIGSQEAALKKKIECVIFFLFLFSTSQMT